jgi:hypothetical protein
MLIRCLFCRLCGGRVSNFTNYSIRFSSALPKAKPNIDEFPDFKDSKVSKLENEVPLIPGICEVAPKTLDVTEWQKVKNGPSGLIDGYLQVCRGLCEIKLAHIRELLHFKCTIYEVKFNWIS